MITFKKFLLAKTIYYVSGYINKQQGNKTPEFVKTINAIPFATEKEAVKFMEERNHDKFHLNVGEVEHLNLYKHKMTKGYKEMLNHIAMDNESMIYALDFWDMWDDEKDIFLQGSIKKRNE